MGNPIAKDVKNKLRPGQPKIIYMDAGCWQSHEKGMPVTTFCLIEHNAIALCSYISDGTYTELPNIPEIGYQFTTSNIQLFLLQMVQMRFNITLSDEDPITGFFIKKIIPFPEKSLLDSINELQILIPDLHLHYFKWTHLDNFITYYGNRYNSGRVHPVQLNGRASLENDFGNFLLIIKAFQDYYIHDTKVSLLGDAVELWETYHVLNHFKDKEELNKWYRNLDAMALNIYEDIKKHPNPKIRKLKEIIPKITSQKLSEIKLDAIIEKVVFDFYNSPKLRELLINEQDDSSFHVKRKARGLREEIFKKHYGPNGKNFIELLGQIHSNLKIWGNHDNYTEGLIECNYHWDFDYDVNEKYFEPTNSYENCISVFAHGHNMDTFNNDEACALGNIITLLLTFYESKGLGDATKEIEEVFRSESEVRNDYIRKISKICYGWDNYKKRTNKNKLFVLAHTHMPYLKNITNEYVNYLKNPSQ